MLTAAILIILIFILITLLGWQNVLTGVIVITLYPFMWVSDKLYSRKLRKEYIPNEALIRILKCYECGGFNHIHYEGCSHSDYFYK